MRLGERVACVKESKYIVTDNTVDIGFYSRWFYSLQLSAILQLCTVTVLMHLYAD
jgi:hypothetical protein